MKFYLKDFCIFISVAETGSLSKTAELMGLSISSVSKRITRLEEYLQTTLFDKNTRRVKLSPLGKHAYIRSKEITHLFSNFVDEIRGSSITTLKVVLDTSDTLIPYIDWVYEYSNSKNNPSFQINSSLERKASDEISLDEIIISSNRSTYPSAIHRKITPVKRKIYARKSIKNHLDIKNKNIIFYSIRDNEKIIIKKTETGEKIELEPVIKTNSISVALKLMDDENSIVFGIPEFIMNDDSNKEKFSNVMHEWEIEPIQYFLIWKERRFYKEEFNEFINFIEKSQASFLTNKRF